MSYNYEELLYNNEELIWIGNPIAGASKGRIVLQFIWAFIILIIVAFYIITLPEYSIWGYDEFFTDTIAQVVVVIMCFFAFFLVIEPFIEKIMNKNTTFVITSQRIITVMKTKKRETKITKTLSANLLDRKNDIVVIGLNTKNQLFKWNYNPLADYLFWDFHLYSHYLYGIEYQVYQEISILIEKVETEVI